VVVFFHRILAQGEIHQKTIKFILICIFTVVDPGGAVGEGHRGHPTNG